MSTRLTRFALTLILLMTASAVLAQNNRSFVSTTGNDANSCTAGNECRSFVRAMAVTAIGGEIIAISSGGYGAFTINKTVTIIGAPGVTASITVSGAEGITISAAGSDRVNIRNLNITQTAPGHIGVYASSYGTLAVENCTVTGGSYGIVIAGGAGSFATLSGNAVRGMASEGIRLLSPAAVVRNRVEGSGAGIGVALYGGVGPVDPVVSAVDLVSVGSQYGVYVTTLVGGHAASLDLDHAMVAGNGSHGVWADGGTGGVSLRVTNSMVTENVGSGFLQTGTAAFLSLGNNLVGGNAGGDQNGTVTPFTAR